MRLIPDQLNTNKNMHVLKYLEGFSCHGDIVEPLERVIREYEEIKSFCPDPVNFKYCFWYIGDEIFAYGVGMMDIGVKLSDIDIREQWGIDRISEVGDPWYLVPWDSEKWDEIVPMILKCLSP